MRDTRNTHSLGFGDHQDVVEHEQVSVLLLHAGLQLDVSVEEEGPVGAGEEGLDQRAGLWAHGDQEALPVTGKYNELFVNMSPAALWDM